MDDGARDSSESEAVKVIVADMLHEGFEPAILVFLHADGNTRLLHREGLDAEDLLRFLLATGIACELRH